MRARQIWIRWATLIGLAVVYFVAGKLGLSLASVPPSATAVWAPTTGLALAAFLLLGYDLWPAILVGAFLVNLMPAGTVVTSLCIAVGNTLEGLVGAYLVNRFAHGRQAFEHPVDVVKFVIFARLLSPTVSATIGVTSLAVTGFAPWADYAAMWFTWWMGDGLGALLLAPLLILWGSQPFGRWPPARTLEAGLTLGSLMLISLNVFVGPFSPLIKNYPLEYLCIFPILWAAFRLGRREAATAIFSLAMIAIWGTLHGAGPLVRGSQRETLLVVQVFVGVITVMGLVVSASVALRRRIESVLQGAYTNLEQQVAERTHSLSQALEALQTEIAERQQIEVALRESEERFSKAFHANPAIMTISRLADGYMLEVNESFERVTGYAPEDVVGRTPAEFSAYVNPDERARMVQLMRAQGFVRDFEMKMRAKSGAIREVLASTQLIELKGQTCMLGIFYDITERKQAEEALRQQTQLYESMLRAQSELGDGVAITEGTGFVYLNEALCQMYGYSAEELYALFSFLELVVPEDRARLTERLRQRLQGADTSDRGETVVIRKDGRRINIEYSMKLMPVGDHRRVFSIIRDITKRKQAEAQLRASLEEKEVLLKEIHHRVKNNLQIVSSLLKLQAESVSDPQIIGLFQESRNRVRAMGLLHERLYQSENLAHIDFADYVRGLVTYLSRSYSLGEVQIRVTVDNLALDIERAVPLGLIINELVSNSFKHAFPQGPGPSAALWVTLERHGDVLALVVGDNGVGLADELDIDHPASMGLQLVKSLTRQLRGTLTVTRPPQGALFTVMIPEETRADG